MTVKGIRLMTIVRPTGSAAPKRSVAAFQPRKATLRPNRTSSTLKNRPPARADWERRSANSAVVPWTSRLISLPPAEIWNEE